MSDDICPTCNGRSWVVAWTKHNGRAHPDKASRCPDCPRDPRQELLEAGAPERHLDNWLGVWDAVWRARPMWASLWLDWVCNGGELPPQVEVASGVYAGNGNRRILTLTGDPGTGKSMIAAKLAHRWLKEGNRGVIWAPAAPAFDRVQRERLEDGHSAYERRMMAADFLVLDEIRFMRRDPTTAQTTFYGWVFDRHDGPGVTILTSNLPLHILAGDEALFDRLSGGVWAELKGKSYRNRTSSACR